MFGLSYIRPYLNFYRLHFLAFIAVPLVGATITWASNGSFPLHFVDALFISVSGVTGTGLVTADLSSLTVWQQVLLVIMEIVGNQAFVAWTVVVVRRWYFTNRLKHIVAAEMQRAPTAEQPQDTSPSLRHIRETLERFKNERKLEGPKPRSKSPAELKRGIRADMIRRLDVEPRPINPVGSQAPTLAPTPTFEESEIRTVHHTTSRRSLRSAVQVPPEPGHDALSHGEDEFGGLPSFDQMLLRVLGKISPRFKRKLRRTLTMPRAETLIPTTGGSVIEPEGPVKTVPYLRFTATVNANSKFYGLTAENFEELGGVEYSALSALLWIIPAYYFGLLAISFVVIAPYMSLARWRENFFPPLQHKVINPVWFSAFQVVGAWANTGMSLVDQNLVPFQEAYPMTIFLVICVLAGNTCLPIFLRCFIWILTKIPGRSRRKEALHFLLDHPRRCTIYLFPSRQTWLLIGTVMVLNLTNLLFDLVLNIGNSVTEALPFGVRFMDGILNAAACRNAGYQPIPVTELMPAVQVLSVVMMYIAIYPIAMSVRATNVYEEKSLGVYERFSEDDEINDDAHWNQPSESRVAIWGRYLVRHARRQLSFDMWWLAISLFLLCIIERDNLTDSNKTSYFNIFALLFELVSAYGTVGLSLGIPGLNYSLSGGMHTLSKLIVCLVMLRGRHRGLPVALDRAVLLPSEFLATLPRQRSAPDEKKDAERAKSELSNVPETRQPPPSLDPQALAAHMRTRTRTISLVVDERREAPGPSSLGAIPEAYGSGVGRSGKTV